LSTEQHHQHCQQNKHRQRQWQDKRCQQNSSTGKTGRTAAQQNGRTAEQAEQRWWQDKRCQQNSSTSRTTLPAGIAEKPYQASPAPVAGQRYQQNSRTA
jgi:hypothetical protein